MIDPLSVAGLTLAAVDALIKLGECSAEIISDVHGFDDDTQQCRTLITDETLRTRDLRNLLFSELAIYGNKTLFEHFDSDVQNQVDILLIELKGTLSQACDLLERHSNGRSSSFWSSPSSTYLPVTPPPPSPSSSSQRPDISSKRSFSGLLKWTLRDKKRVETVIQTFVDRNNRLHEKIKLWCLASQLGVRTDHLVHLREDETSKKLGFDKDAALKLTQWGTTTDQASLELIDPSWNPYMEAMVGNNSPTVLATFVKDGTVYLRESHPCRPIDSEEVGQSHALDARTRNRVEALAKLLHQPKERIFRILPCVGWKYIAETRVIAFVFEVIPEPAGAPVSLLRLLQHTDHRPELGDKFRLAAELARCISQLHLVKWLHESFRSENVLLFPGKRASEQDTAQPVRYTEPWVVGFSFSRPEPFFSAGRADWDPTREIYRHPDRQGQPMETFRKIHDIYALGVVLLEIGLWEPAIKLEKNMFAHAKDTWAVQAQLLKHAQKRLEPRVGRKYKDIVVKCLTGNFGVSYDDTREEMALQQAFRSQVVDVLETSANALS